MREGVTNKGGGGGGGLSRCAKGSQTRAQVIALKINERINERIHN